MSLLGVVGSWFGATESRGGENGSEDGSAKSHTMARGSTDVLEKAVFCDVLKLERHRAERSRRAFLLMLFAFPSAEKGQLSMSQSILTCLFSCTRGTDLIGWYETGRTIGLLCTELGDVDDVQDAVRALVSKIASALRQAVRAEEFRRITMSAHVYPQSKGKRDSGRMDRVFFPDELETTSWARGAGKRTFDMIGSMLALIAFSPILLLIALLVKLTSRGPVFYRQTRVGWHGETFAMWKFRSMTEKNDPALHEAYVKKLIAGHVASDGVYKIQEDPRVTRIGRFLRKSSLDELPQFWNVLVGDMSLVGPRPPISYEVAEYDIWHRRRLQSVKPGITGLWQVSGRSRTSFDQMVRLDLRYAALSCFWLDLKILLRTPLAVMAGSGAC